MKLKTQVYLCKNLRISCLAGPSSSHAFANFTLSFSALFLSSWPFSPRHKSIIRRASIPMASRVPAGTSPFLCKGLRPCPVLTWKSSKATLRFSVRCAAAIGWSEPKGQQILPKKVKYRVVYHKKGLQRSTAPKRFTDAIETTMRNKPSSCLYNLF